MAEDVTRRLYMELVLFDDLFVVLDALLQHMIMRRQMCVHQTERTAVQREPDADGPFVAPNTAQASARVFRLHLAYVQQMCALSEQKQQQALHLLGLYSHVIAVAQQLLELGRPRVFPEQALDDALRMGVDLLQSVGVTNNKI